MAEKSVTVRFRTREEEYLARNPDGTIAGFNKRGEPLRARLEIDEEKTSGSDPYNMVYTLWTDTWRGQDVFLRYYSNSDDPIVVRTTNGEAVITATNLVSAQRTESLVFTNQSAKAISGIPTGGVVNSRWVGNVLSSGSGSGGAGSAEAAALCAGEKIGSGPHVAWDGENLHVPEAVTGVMEVTYTETYAEIRSNAAEVGTVVIAVCQGSLAEAEQYEIGYPEAGTVNPDDECCRDDDHDPLSIPDSFDGDPGWGTAVYVFGGCPPYAWSVEGMGFSMLRETTAIARHNTVEIAEEGCGDGILSVTDACGDSVESVVETDTGCCEDQGGEPLAWADGNGEAVCMSTTYHETFAVTGGAAPYEWAITQGEDVASWGVDTTTGPANNLRTWASEPTTIRVRVSDSCGEVIHRDISLGMEWAEDNPETIGQGDEVAISVVGGVPPFHWSISGGSGTGFSLGVSTTEDRVNLLITDDSACGGVEISVTDDCGQTVSGGIRCTADSDWSDPSADVVCTDNNGWNPAANTCWGAIVKGIYKYQGLRRYEVGPERIHCDEPCATMILDPAYGLTEGECQARCNPENDLLNFWMTYHWESGTYMEMRRSTWSCT